MRKKANKRMSMDDIYEICILCHGNSRKKAELYQLTLDENDCVACPMGIHPFRLAE